MSNDLRTVYIGNLDEGISKSHIYELFMQAGPLEQVNIPFDRETKKSKNFGFVTFQHECSVPYAVYLLNNIKLCGRNIRVDSRNSKVRLPDIHDVGVHSLDPNFRPQDHYGNRHRSVQQQNSYPIIQQNSYPLIQQNNYHPVQMMQYGNHRREMNLNLPQMLYAGSYAPNFVMNNEPYNDLRQRITMNTNNRNRNYESSSSSRSYMGYNSNNNINDHMHRSSRAVPYNRDDSHRDKSNYRDSNYNQNRSSSTRYR